MKNNPSRPLPMQPRPSSTLAEDRFLSTMCYYCGLKGHLARSCEKSTATGLKGASVLRGKVRGKITRPAPLPASAISGRSGPSHKGGREDVSSRRRRFKPRRRRCSPNVRRIRQAVGPPGHGGAVDLGASVVVRRSRRKVGRR